MPPGPMPTDPISERTRVSITLSSWWHIVLVITTIMFWGFEIKDAIDKDREQSQQNHTDILKIQEEIQLMQRDLAIFHTKYEDDMNRYIRDYSSRK